MHVQRTCMRRARRPCSRPSQCAVPAHGAVSASHGAAALAPCSGQRPHALVLTSNRAGWQHHATKDTALLAGRYSSTPPSSRRCSTFAPLSQGRRLCRCHPLLHRAASPPCRAAAPSPPGLLLQLLFSHRCSAAAVPASMPPPGRYRPRRTSTAQCAHSCRWSRRPRLLLHARTVHRLPLSSCKTLKPTRMRKLLGWTGSLGDEESSGITCMSRFCILGSDWKKRRWR